MRAYALHHLGDDILLRDLNALVAEHRVTTALLLAHLAEVDARKLYLPAGYPSMFAYCIDELHFSEDAALKRIQAARAARQFPVLLAALADGRLHLKAVRLLAPYLTSANVADLVAVATHRAGAEIEQMLASRFPSAETLGIEPVVRRLPEEPSTGAGAPPHAPGHVGGAGASAGTPPPPPAPHAPGHVRERAKATPLSPERFALQVTIDKSTYQKLLRVQELLSHALPSGDVAQVLDRALDALLAQLQKRKFAAAEKPGRARRSRDISAGGRFPGRDARHIPAEVKRAVWERDEGQCSFVSEQGRRCKARHFLEFDHVEPVARGGEATVDGMRLRCRGHNQYEAERVFGAPFMEAKRRQASVQQDLIAGLRSLGVGLAEARRAIEQSGALHAATLEESLRAALRCLGPKGAKVMAASA